MEIWAIYYKLTVSELLFIFFVIFQTLISPCQVVGNGRSIAHFPHHFMHSPHAFTCNLSCVDEV